MPILYRCINTASAPWVYYWADASGASWAYICTNTSGDNLVCVLCSDKDADVDDGIVCDT